MRTVARRIRPGGLAGLFILLWVVLLGVLGLASSAGANPPDSTSPNDPMRAIRTSSEGVDRAAELEAPVSTSPIGLATARALPVHDVPSDQPDDTPLTRAAAQQRVENMSPVGWLSRYGPVRIGRSE